MRLRLIQIDAFADRVFRGNPAAVMPLPHWLPDPVLQALAEENNLSETAFYVADLPPEAGSPPETTSAPGNEPAYHLRWFTPAIEVDLCGHATLATAGHLFEDAHPGAEGIRFWTRSGWLSVRRGPHDGELELDFPAGTLREIPDGDRTSTAAVAALGVEPEVRLRDTDLVYVLADEAAVRTAAPDFTALARLPVRGVVVTAPGDAHGVDFVSRWFGAAAGISEDPVTGALHSQIAPYWAQRLGRTRLTARQLSARGGMVRCEVDGDRVRLAGTYHRYLDGTVTIPDLPE
ncbi:PhzF family phenazine biosynthesis protein [Plantactinospora sp. CA-290183]|uniref:PhzF family phenazine biosynthesis protein n=1 Tax=Plantactinospora sp. CA-290183 TaxID=3240006 RepID=UPI003D8E249D